MTAPLDLDALDSLLAKATPGPWEQYDHDGPTNFKGTQAEYLASIKGEGWSSACTAFGILGPTPNFDKVAHLGELYHNGRVRVEEERANAALMVALRNAAPALVAELRAAREALMCCALPLEVLAATECDVAGKALAPETKAAVMNAVKAIRLTLSRAATGGNSNG